MASRRVFVALSLSEDDQPERDEFKERANLHQHRALLQL